MMKTFIATLMVVVLAIVAGCSSRKGEKSAGADATAIKAIGATYLADEEPAEPRDVGDVVDRAGDKEHVTVLGRIGGSEEPFVSDLAAFTIVDRKLKPCNEIEGDTCPKPWDYCCESDALPKNSMTVKFVDNNGKVVPIDAKELFQLKELQTVVVSGELQKTEDGSVALLAKKMYVRK